MSGSRQCSRCGLGESSWGGGDVCPVCLVAGGAESAGEVAAEFAALERRFPRHEVRSRLGQGGMGVVYEVWHRDLGRRQALKVIAPHAAGSGMVHRFRAEARALAAVDHPHVVKVHDAGEVEGQCYLLMELVEGENLRELLRERTPSLAESMRIVGQVCDALSYLHGLKIVHRDIKPENVLLGEGGRVKVVDFGLAKVLDRPAEALTDSRGPLGTYDYMAPEQRANPRDVDERTDVYSVGVVLYEMLTGERPQGNLLTPLQNARIDGRLQAVLLRALETDRDRRHRTVEQLRADLAPWHPESERRDPKLSSRVSKKGKPMSKLLNGGRRKAVIATLAALVIVAGGTWFLWPKNNPPVASAAPPPAFEFTVAEKPTPPPEVKVDPPKQPLPPVPETEPPTRRELDEVIRGIAPLLPLQPTRTDQLASRETKFGETSYIIEEKYTHDAQQNLEEIITWMDTEDVWPGGLLQGKTLRDRKYARPAPLAVKSRRPLNLSFINLTHTGPKADSPGASTVSYVKTLEAPSLAAFTQAHAQLREQANDLVAPADFQFEVVEAYSKDHLFFQLKADARYLSAAMHFEGEHVRDRDKGQIFVFLRQDYYKIAIDAPASTVDLFGNDVTKDDFKDTMGPDNPPVYVKSVTYGRMIVAEVTSDVSSSKLKAALNASFQAAVAGGSVNVSAEHAEAIKRSTFKIRIRGGPAENAPLELNGFEAMKKMAGYIQSGAKLSVNNPGVPVAFSVCNLRDNTTAALHSISRHSLIDRIGRPYRYQIGWVNAEINDDHDGFPNGEGDWMVMMRQGGDGVDIARWWRGMSNGNHGVNWWTDKIAAPGKKFMLHVRIGEEDSSRDQNWDGMTRMDGYLGTSEPIDLEQARNGPIPLEFHTPGDDGGNRFRFQLRLLGPDVQ